MVTKHISLIGWKLCFLNQWSDFNQSQIYCTTLYFESMYVNNDKKSKKNQINAFFYTFNLPYLQISVFKIRQQSLWVLKSTLVYSKLLQQINATWSLDMGWHFNNDEKWSSTVVIEQTKMNENSKKLRPPTHKFMLQQMTVDIKGLA